MVGLAAAAMLGIDHSAVYWAIGGWRDELFAFFAVSCAWAWSAVRAAPHTRECRSRRRAQRRRLPDEDHDDRAHRPCSGLAAGDVAIRRCDRRRYVNRRREGRQLALAVGIAAVLVAPFLINCAIATGDPFYAINNHTDFYLKREGVPDVRPISAVRYSVDKFESRPIAATDNAVRGIFVYPFANKWVGLNRWYPGLGTVLAGLAIAGLVAWLWWPEGRLLLVMFFGSLVPFSMTWTVLGGAEWRLTLFAYAFYLIAAFWVVDKAVRFVRAALIAW